MTPVKTKGIVLNYHKYSESSIILNVLTEDFGKLSFIVNGVRKKKSKIPINYFQAFNILQIVFLQSPKSDLHRIVEVNNENVLQNIIFDLNKSSICMFLSEMVLSIYHSSEKDKSLYSFLENLIEYIDSASIQAISNIHIWTLIRLMQFSGIGPENNFSKENPFFDLIEGRFTNSKLLSNKVFNAFNSQILSSMLKSNINESGTISLSRQQRNDFLSEILRYFQIHIEGLRNNKSLKVLTEVFS